MLQQTRARTAIPYFERFLERFPTVEALAAAGEEEVLALWSGLGYYSRARNLLRAARRVAAAGVFPRDYESIRALPGVGGYTAAAIASIAFGLPRAALDGNAMRVVARIENDPADIGAARTRERFRAAAQEWMGARSPGAFNQALMELGATVCLPKNPLCQACPLESLCAARAAGTVADLPVKPRKKAPVRIAGALLIVRKGESVLLRKEEKAAARMAGFWSLPSPGDLPEARIGARVGEFRHSITHHRYTFTVYSAQLVRSSQSGSEPRPLGSGCQPALGPRPPELQWFEPARFAAIPLGTIGRKGLRLAGIG